MRRQCERKMKCFACLLKWGERGGMEEKMTKEREMCLRTISVDISRLILTVDSR